MNIQEIVSGIAYFESLFSLVRMSDQETNTLQNLHGFNRPILSNMTVFNCPITNRRFLNAAEVREFSLPFLAAVRNALLARPSDFFSLVNVDALLHRFRALVNQAGIETDQVHDPVALQANWIRAHQILQAVQQQHVISNSQDTLVVEESDEESIFSPSINPSIVLEYTPWQQEILIGLHEGAYQFNLNSESSQNDLVYVNQNEFQNTILSDLARQWEIMAPTLRTMHEQEAQAVAVENSVTQSDNRATRAGSEMLVDSFFDHTPANAVTLWGQQNAPDEDHHQSDWHADESIWGNLFFEPNRLENIQNNVAQIEATAATRPTMIFSSSHLVPIINTPVITSISEQLLSSIENTADNTTELLIRPISRLTWADVVRRQQTNSESEEEENETQVGLAEMPAEVNNEIIIMPVERREIIIPDADHFIYQGQPRLTNLPLVGPYLSTLALPSIPIIQPYNPNSNARPDVISESLVPHGNIRVSVAVQLAQNLADLPAGVLDRLAEQQIDREQLEVFVSIQDNPWENDAERLLRVHPYIHPFAEGAAVDVENTVQVSIAEIGARFSPFSPYVVQTHHGVFSPQNMQIIGGLDFSRTQSLYSLCTNPRTNRMALTLHVLLSDSNQRFVLQMLSDITLNDMERFINSAEIINAVSEESDQLPVTELRYLMGMDHRPQIDSSHLIESQRQLAVEVRRALSTSISLPSERLLSQEFSGQHSAGGANRRLENATNRAGLNFVESVLGSDFLNNRDASAAQHLNMLIQNFSNYLMDHLTESLRESSLFLGEQDPSHYNDMNSPHVYFHRYAVAIRAILHNARIRQGYNGGILLKEIAAIWYSVRHLPSEERDIYINNVLIQIHEIQRAYNIARFYQHFFYSDNRSPEDWGTGRQCFYINNAKDAWVRIESQLERVRALFVNRPTREFPEAVISEEALSAEQTLLIRQHAQADRRAEQFERVRAFILNTEAEGDDGDMHITHEMAGIEVEVLNEGPGHVTNRIVRRTGVGVLETFIKLVELSNRLDYPTSAIATDNFLADTDSCGPGAETRLLDIANTLPEIRVITISSLQATQLFQELIAGKLRPWIDETIIAQYAEPESIRVLLENQAPSEEALAILAPLFVELSARIHRMLHEMAVDSPEIRVALTVRNTIQGTLVIDEVIQTLLENFNIYDRSDTNTPQNQEEYSDGEGEYQSYDELEEGYAESEAETENEVFHARSAQRRP